MRRLPVYLLLDTSGSMFGEPIEAVRNGLQVLLSSLRSDPYALETVYLSVITFDSTARQVSPLTELMSFREPTLNANGCTALGGALQLLCDCIDKDLIKGTSETKGDWRPLVFLMTDGSPTDSITKGLEAVKKHKFGAFVACAAGAGADTSVLRQITECVVSLDTTDRESIKQFFQWVSASVSVGSTKVDSTGQDSFSLDELPPPPSEIKIVD